MIAVRREPPGATPEAFRLNQSPYSADSMELIGTDYVTTTRSSCLHRSPWLKLKYEVTLAVRLDFVSVQVFSCQTMTSAPDSKNLQVGCPLSQADESN